MTPEELERLLLDPTTVVTLDTVAGLLGIHPRSVTSLAKEGSLVRQEKGRYLLRESFQTYISKLRESAAGRGGNVVDLTAERALLAREQREGQALKNAVLRGDLIPVERVLRAIERDYAIVRQRMLGVSGRLSSRLAPQDVDAVEDEINEALADLYAPADTEDVGEFVAGREEDPATEEQPAEDTEDVA